MKPLNENLSNAINELIVINNDRMEGYTTAAKESKDSDLADLFYTNAFKSKEYADQLTEFVISLGAEPATGTKETGKIYRVWMDIKAALAKNDRKAVLSSCEFGEDVALKHYDDFLNNQELIIGAEMKDVIFSQRDEIQAAHDHIKQMREATRERIF